MEIKNLEEVFHLLKMKSNTENLLAYIKAQVQHRTAIPSAGLA